MSLAVVIFVMSLENVIYLKIVLLVILILIPFIIEKGIKLYHPALIVSIAYFANYALPSLFMIPNQQYFWFYGFYIETLNKGMDFIILVFLLFLIGFYLPVYNKSIKRLTSNIINVLPNIHNYNLGINNLPAVSVFLILSGWICRFILMKLGFYVFLEAGDAMRNISGVKLYIQYLSIGSYFPMIAIFFIFYEWLKNKEKTRYLVISLLLLVIEVAYAIPSGSKERVLMPVILLLILYSLKDKIPVFAVFITTIIVVFFIFPFGNIYRASYTGNVASDFSYAFSRYIDLYFSFNIKTLNDIFFAIFGERLNYAFITSRIVEDTPKIWNFQLGYSYLLFFIGLIPRIFWPNKPEISAIGNDFGRDYGFLNPSDYMTSIGMSWVGEIFINFGWYGVLCGLFYGVLYRLIYDYFLKEGKLASLSAILYVFAAYMMSRSDSFAEQFGTLAKIYIILLILLFPFIRKKET